MELINITDVNNTEDVSLQGLRAKYQTIIAALFLLLTIIFGLLGNTAVIAVVCMQRSMRREASNLLIVNLCVTDLCNTVFVMSSAFLALVYDEWTFGTVWCDCICAMNYCLIIVSMLTLCCISLDRYQAVMYPLSYRVKIKRKHMMVVIVYTWIQGITFGLAPSASGWVAYDYWEAICAIQWQLYHPDSVIYVALAFAFCFLIPGIVLIHCYVKILKEVKKQKAHLKFNVSGDSYTNEQNKRKVSDRTKIVWSLLVVVLAYFICTTPFSVTKLIKVIVHDTNFIPGPINLVASLLGYVASAINPLIYGIFRRDFRTAYKRLLCTVLLGRKYPAAYDIPTNSGSHARTITQANHCTNHDTDMSGLESALNELEFSKKIEYGHPSPSLSISLKKSPNLSVQFKHPLQTPPTPLKNSSPSLSLKEWKLKNDSNELKSAFNELEINMNSENVHSSQTVQAQLNSSQTLPAQLNEINSNHQGNGIISSITEQVRWPIDDMDDFTDSMVSFKQINVKPVQPTDRQ